jgi:hypothetical protein
MTFDEWVERSIPMTDQEKTFAWFAWKAATGAEREACAAVCEVKANENADKWEGDEAKAASRMMLQCAAAIRKRSNK